MNFNKQLRFGLRKSRVYGTLCSAVLGAFIMAGPIVHADEAQPLNTTTETVSTDTSKTATLATEVVTDHASQTAILATENTRVADTTVANTTTENTETSPYVSDKAVAAAKEAFDNNQLPPTEVGGLFLSSVVKRLKADSLPKDSVL